MAKKVEKKEKKVEDKKQTESRYTKYNTKDYYDVINFNKDKMLDEGYQRYLDDVYFKNEKFDKLKNPLKEAMTHEMIKNIFIIAVVIMLMIFVLMNINKVFEFIVNIVNILKPIIIGWVLTFIMAPLYNLTEKKLTNKKNKEISKFSKTIATVVCVLVVLIFTLGIIFLFVPQLYSSITRFTSRFGGYISNIQGTIENLRSQSNNDATNGLLNQLEGFLSNLRGKSSNLDYSAIASSVFRGFAVSAQAVMTFFIGIIVMIYSLNIKEELISGVKRALFALVRKDWAKKILDEAKYTKKVFEGFFIGKALDSLIIGVICYICCAIMKMPYTPLIAVIVGITNIIPFFGPFIGAAPSFVLILLEEPFTLKPYVFLVFVLILQQIDGNIIGPKILGDKTGVGSFWVLFSIILFGGLFGFVGMIIAVPLWAVITRIFDQIITAKLKQKHYPTNAADYQYLKEYNKTLKK